jgi:hypothetical protein
MTSFQVTAQQPAHSLRSVCVGAVRPRPAPPGRSCQPRMPDVASWPATAILARVSARRVRVVQAALVGGGGQVVRRRTRLLFLEPWPADSEQQGGPGLESLRTQLECYEDCRPAR